MTSRGCCGAVLAAAMLGLAPGARGDVEVATLTDLSLEELSNLEVTSVSKSSETLQRAPAAIFVITHDDIIRSGVTSIPEALRLAPNLQITQFSSTKYIAGARGLGGHEEDQNFSNKLLILIDGRSVYTPLYSGVYLDSQDLLMDDIDRIEVISGPGATLWGANAMNGVINIITRPAYLTGEKLLNFSAGNQERTASGRWAGKVADRTSYRLYAKAFARDQMEDKDEGAGDAWDKIQGGYRADWTGASNTVTTSGDLYNARQIDDGRVRGANLLARWQNRGALGEFQVQGYFDYTRRTTPVNGAGFSLRTWDLELQHGITLGRNRIVWGAGARLHDYDIQGTDMLLFDPPDRELFLGNLFAQDTFALTGSVDLTAGLKFEHDPYSGWEPLPDLRAAWRVTDKHLLWASAARAVRSPTPFDRDVIERVNPPDAFLIGGESFKTEKVYAFEIGYRTQPSPVVTLSATTFYNRYDDLRSIEITPDTFIPLFWGNHMEGRTYGVEIWGKWQVAKWWRLSPGVRTLKKDLHFDHDTSLLLRQSGNDPEEQALLTSSMDFASKVTFDTTLRWVNDLPNPHLGSYTELQASVDWHVSPRADISLSGFNLLKERHLEYPASSAEYIRRSVIVQARITFQ